jgi:hypothetical protein
VAGGYNRALVEHLLPGAWDGAAAYGMKVDTQPTADMPKGHKDPKKGSPLMAHLADIKAAWKWAKNGGLSPEVQRALIMRYGLDWTLEVIALSEGVRHQSISERCERGIGKLAAHLNGERYVDGYDNDIEEEAA